MVRVVFFQELTHAKRRNVSYVASGNRTFWKRRIHAGNFENR